jgi:hypothetical protein
MRILEAITNLRDDVSSVAHHPGLSKHMMHRKRCDGHWTQGPHSGHTSTNNPVRFLYAQINDTLLSYACHPLLAGYEYLLDFLCDPEMEVGHSSKTSNFYQTEQHHIPEYIALHSHCCQNFIS